MIFIWILAFAVTITIHEAAHALIADRLGDPTARLAGRLSLNPIKHYDPIGTTLLLVTAILTAMGRLPFPFGWAKPVPVDPYNLQNPKRDSAIVSIAGPAANLLLALILATIIRIFPTVTIFSLFYPVILLNVALAIFNLIPIHPLDGGKVLVGILPARQSREVDMFLNRFGVILLFFLIFPTFGGSSLISLIINPIMTFILRLLIPRIAIL